MKLKKLLAILIAFSVACVLMCSVSVAGENEGTVTLSYANKDHLSPPGCNLMIGGYVTATVSNLPEDVTKLKYEFKVGEDINKTTEVMPTDSNFLTQEYSPTIDDAGKTITVTVTVYQDDTSHTLSPVTSETVVAPTPVLVNLTENGFTIINFNSAYEYAIIKLYGTSPTESDWKTLDNGVVTGLEEATTYYVYARVTSNSSTRSKNVSATTLTAPKTGDFTYETTSATYTGAENRASVTSSVHTGKFTLEYRQNSQNVTPKNAGTYQLYAIVQDHHVSGTSVRYASSEVYLGAWEIKKCPVSITPTVQEKLFDNNWNATILPGALTGTVEGDDVSVTPTSLAGSFMSKYVGNNITVSTSENFTLTGTDAPNYALTVNNYVHSGNIKPALQTITLEDSEPHIYQNAPAADISNWASSNVSGAQLTYTLVGTPTGITLTTVDGKPMLSASPAENTATSFSIKVTAAAKDIGGDSTPEYSETSQTFTVTAGKQNPGLTITGETTKTYGDEPFTVTASLGNSVPANDGGTWQWTTSNSNVLAFVGDADNATPQVKVAGAGIAKLTVTYISNTYKGNAEITISVGKRTVTVSVGTYSITKEYDGTESPGTGSGALAVTGILDSDSSSVSVSPRIPSYANGTVGGQISTHLNIELMGDKKDNYQLAASTIQGIPCSITPKELTITGATAVNRAYVEGSKAVTITGVTFSGALSQDAPLQMGEYQHYTATGEMTDDTAGDGKTVTVTVTLTSYKGRNYTLASGTFQTTVNISKAEPADPTNLRGQQGEVLSTVQLPANWTWDAGNTIMTVGTHTYPASYTETDNYVAKNHVSLTVDVQPTDISDSSSNSYAIIVEETANGNITVSAKSSVRYSTVTITAVPDSGYTLETLKVLDQNGQEISVVPKDGKYTFTMPGGKVTVKGTFAKDNTLQNFFTDVPTDAYYYEAVMWAAKNGITDGTTATTFSPDQDCTRAQIITFIYRYMK